MAWALRSMPRPHVSVKCAKSMCNGDVTVGYAVSVSTFAENDVMLINFIVNVRYWQFFARCYTNRPFGLKSVA